MDRRRLGDERLDGPGERVVRVVDEDVAGAQGAEDIGRALGGRGRSRGMTGWNGAGLRSGRSRLTRLHRSARPSGAGSSWTSAVPICISRVSRAMTWSGIPCSTSSRTAREPESAAPPRSSRAGPPPRRRRSRGRSGGSPGSPRLGDDHAGEQAVEVGGDHVLEGHQAGPCPLPSANMKRGRSGGTLIRANSRQVAWSRTSTARLSDRFEMYGNGCAGSTASGVRTGKIWTSKVSWPPARRRRDRTNGRSGSRLPPARAGSHR